MKDETKREIRRMSIHIIPGVLGPIVVTLPACFFGELIGRILGVSISMFFFILYFLNQLYLSGKISREIPITTATYRIMARDYELEKRTFLGGVYFWAILVVMFLFFDLNVAMVGVWISSMGDATAAIVGREFGVHKIPYNKRKSVEGFVAFILAAFIGTLAYLLVFPPCFCDPILMALFLSILGAILESLPGSYLLDEITVPLIPALVLQIIGHYPFFLLS
ncbi:MAG: diacylglycerol/polyprenol kinase family protein [Candidatus Asgardarchaeia archaeon]